jgi:flagellar basal-body rod modification protein FlgD
MSVSAVSTAASAATASSSSATTALSSGDFLTLLINELQNQNPLDPTNTTDFVNQLTSYASFEQQQTINSNLSGLTTSFNSLMTLNSVNYIGHQIEAKGDTATLQNGEIAFGYSLNSAATSVTLSVADSTGKVVWTGSGTGTSGANSFTWDGKSSNGTQLSDGGQYTLKVAATDAKGESVYGYTTVAGTVSTVDFSSGTLKLKVGNTSINSADVLGVTS